MLQIQTFMLVELQAASTTGLVVTLLGNVSNIYEAVLRDRTIFLVYESDRDYKVRTKYRFKFGDVQNCTIEEEFHYAGALFVNTSVHIGYLLAELNPEVIVDDSEVAPTVFADKEVPIVDTIEPPIVEPVLEEPKIVDDSIVTAPIEEQTKKPAKK